MFPSPAKSSTHVEKKAAKRKLFEEQSTHEEVCPLCIHKSYLFSPKVYTTHTDARPAFAHITNVNTDFLLTMLSYLYQSRTFPIGSNNLH